MDYLKVLQELIEDNETVKQSKNGRLVLDQTDYNAIKWATNMLEEANEEINKGGLRIYLTDKKYPTLVIEGDHWIKGWDINKDTGELIPTCICAARYEGECACDYNWRD